MKSGVTQTREANAGTLLAPPALSPTAIRWLSPVSIALLCFAANLLLFRHFLHDDALISLCYARHFVDSGELAWNPGERVEGYTNFLHVMATAALNHLGVGLVAAARTINFAALALVILAASRIGVLLRREGIAANWANLPVALVLCSAPLVVWCYGALESTCVAAAVGWATFSLLPLFTAPREKGGGEISRAAWAGVAFCLAYLMRPDSVIFAAASLLAVVLFAERPLKARLTAAGVAGLVLAAVIVLHRAWAFRYYGDLLPNTFYAKTGGALGFVLERGMAYLGRTPGLLPYMPVALAAFALALSRRMAHKSDCFLTMALGMHLAYVVWVGGDHMAAARFLVPIAVPAAVLFASLAARLWSESTSLQLALPVATFAAGLTLLPMGEDPAAEVGAAVGRHIAAAWPAGSTVALHTAGSTPFVADKMIYIDMLG